LWDDAAHKDKYVAFANLAQLLDDLRNKHVMRTGKDRKPDDVNIFLQRGFGNHLWGLAQTSVNHFHAVIAQGARDDFGAAVMSIQTRLGN